MAVVFWFRNDLRLHDNPGLTWAVARARELKVPLVPVYVLESEISGEDENKWAMGGAHRWWLRHSLAALRADLKAQGLELVLRSGEAEGVLGDLMAEVDGLHAVSWNRRYTPWGQRVDGAVKARLREWDVEVASHKANLLFEPWEVKTASTDGPFRVFTPFWKTCLKRAGEIGSPLPAPDVAGLEKLEAAVEADRLEDWGLVPGESGNTEPLWAAGWDATWTPGEAAARVRLNEFLDRGLADYRDGRDRPGEDLTSRMSPRLHWGEVSPREIFTAAGERGKASGGKALAPHIEKLLSELGWREFAYHLLAQAPTLPDAPWKPAFRHFPWREDKDVAADLRRWQRGRTGYPLVDAGMRQLWQTGWMHNRVRLVTASFLIKHLQISWRDGEKWFWDTLVDGDLANNASNWQWVAGSGADASPYFRIFNPVEQSRRFDAGGAYIRQWCPELKGLSDKDIHAPWEAKPEVLAKAGVLLGETYPQPMVEHVAARARALAAFAEMRAAAGRTGEDVPEDE